MNYTIRSFKSSICSCKAEIILRLTALIEREEDEEELSCLDDRLGFELDFC
jgi:hypothetical protein